jgi:DNA repair protein RecO (recombination protein O)
MDERARGIVLRVHPLTETSLIIRWLTPNVGRIATVAKGARRPNSPFRGKLDLFYVADFTFRRSRRSELHTLREVGLPETHAFLRKELGYLQQASYCAALIEQATENETPMTAIFDLMNGFLNHLGLQPPAAQTIFAFELKLLNELGLKPDLARSRATAGVKEVIRALTDFDWDALFGLKLSDPQIVELRQFLHGFLIFHLGKVPAGRTKALQF